MCACTEAPDAQGARQGGGSAEGADDSARTRGEEAVDAPATDGAGDAAAGHWRPRPGVTWQWQLQGRVDTGVRARVYEVDLGVRRAVVRRLHARGRRVICYVSAGSWERWRPDADEFPRAVLGHALASWPGERWLDVRRRDVLRPLMAARLDRCAAKGFDAVEADNVDGWTQRTGFPVTAQHQRAYNRMLAGLAHARGLGVGLKNDLAQVRALEPHFDFAVNEQCVQFRECGRLRPFLDAGKAVLHAEYRRTPREFCPTSRRLGLSSVQKRRALGAWRRSC